MRLIVTNGYRLGTVALTVATMFAFSCANVAAASHSSELPIVSCSAGEQLQMPAAVAVDSDGWTRLTYKIGNVEASKDVPPTGLDLSQVPDDVLAHHGLPTRASYGYTSEDWSFEVGHSIRSRAQGICQPIKSISATGYQRYSHNWGGDEFRRQSAYTFQGVKANMIQPTIASFCTDRATLGSWVGMGGDTPDYPLVQTGTWAGGSFWRGGQPTYAAFWEFIQTDGTDSGMKSFNVAVSAGNTMRMILSTLSSTEIYAEVYNQSNSQLDGIDIYVGSQPFGTNAESIDERLLANGYTPLANYGWTYWYNMAVRRSNETTWTGAYSEATEWWVNMTTTGNSSGKVLSKTTGTYSDNHMRDHWYACQ